MKNYLVQTPLAWPQHNLCLMPKFNKGEKWRVGVTWDDIKDGQFIIINNQHSVVASRQIIVHKDMDSSSRETKGMALHNYVDYGFQCHSLALFYNE